MVKKKASKNESVQPEVNIGMIGHVDHGKTTLVKALSGKWTDTHSEEIKRGITIRLGYADVVVYKCTECKGTEQYNVTPKCKKCGKETEEVRKISLVDAPGHESLMATMLCGANIMDGALLLVAANEKCPQPQTVEHITALEIMGVDKVIIIQNKIDIISEEQAMKNYEEIKKFLKDTKYKDAPIIPMSALHSINMDVLVETIEEMIKTPERNTTKTPIMFVARSFDVNKPGIPPQKLAGGILGGVLRQGKLKIGDEIEILPGYEVEEKNMKVWKTIKTKIAGLMTGGETVEEVFPGGTFGILTSLDPSVVKSDKLVGSVVGYSGKMPKVLNSINIEIHLLKRVVGAKDELVVEALKPNELLMLNVNSAATVGIVKEIGRANVVKCLLRRPVCAEVGARVTISRSVGQRWRLIGYGMIKAEK